MYDPSQNGWGVNVTYKGNEFVVKVAQPYVNKQVAIVVDNTVISDPVVDSGITGSDVRISGNFTATEAKALAIMLRSGPLPSPLMLTSPTFASSPATVASPTTVASSPVQRTQLRNLPEPRAVTGPWVAIRSGESAGIRWTLVHAPAPSGYTCYTIVAPGLNNFETKIRNPAVPWPKYNGEDATCENPASTLPQSTDTWVFFLVTQRSDAIVGYGAVFPKGYTTASFTFADGTIQRVAIDQRTHSFVWIAKRDKSHIVQFVATGSGRAVECGDPVMLAGLTAITRQSRPGRVCHRRWATSSSHGHAARSTSCTQCEAREALVEQRLNDDRNAAALNRSGRA